MTFLEALIVAGTVLIVVRAVHLVRLSRSIPRLADARLPASPGDLPTVTIACAGRDEGENLERAARSWLAQDVPGLQVVLVDDRSRDATPEILARLAHEDPRLLPLRVEERPEGWLGKCHALQVAASHASSEFILFTDADVRLAPGCVARALAVAVGEDADVVVVMPDVECDNALQRAMTAAFFQFFLTTLGGSRANRDDGRCVVGIGAFNLVRRSAYEQVGGHASVRLQVGDDIALIRTLQRAGFRHRLLSGEGLVRLKWQHGVLGTIRGLEKNFFWGARLSLTLVTAFTMGVFVALSPVLAPVAGSPLAWTCLVIWATAMAVPPLVAGPRQGRGWNALLAPAAMGLLVVTAWNSAIRTLARGGIAWRGDVFTIAELRGALQPWRWWREAVPSRPRRDAVGAGKTGLEKNATGA